MIHVLGAGPHGRQIAADYNGRLFDDKLPGYEPVSRGANQPWLVGAVWPEVRRAIAHKARGGVDPYERGVYVAPSATVGIETFLDSHVHVLAGAVVSHGVELGEYSTVATGALICGEARIGAGVFIGAGAVVIHGGITIGDHAVIGAGTVVIDNVPAGKTYIGVPGRCL